MLWTNRVGARRSVGACCLSNGVVQKHLHTCPPSHRFDPALSTLPSFESIPSTDQGSTCQYGGYWQTHNVVWVSVHRSAACTSRFCGPGTAACVSYHMPYDLVLGERCWVEYGKPTDLCISKTRCANSNLPQNNDVFSCCLQHVHQKLVKWCMPEYSNIMTCVPSQKWC